MIHFRTDSTPTLLCLFSPLALLIEEPKDDLVSMFIEHVTCPTCRKIYNAQRQRDSDRLDMTEDSQRKAKWRKKLLEPKHQAALLRYTPLGPTTKTDAENTVRDNTERFSMETINGITYLFDHDLRDRWQVKHAAA